MVKSPTELLVREAAGPYVVAHYVIDASVALKWVWSEESSDRARRYARGAIERELQLSVPSLFWYEVANAMRYGRVISQGENGADPWRLLLAVPMTTVAFRAPAFAHIEALARRFDLTAYDASYVFLAQTLGIPLLTADGRLLERCTSLPFVWSLDAVAPP